ncbi:putative amidoligase enzyme-domain-containing protein [Thermothelomyces heterothallicus CBS 202.75]|uniref:putative amidoligase enzyme-domain-containing protein n=1 Tax=Thermothelomyces heterothallicus CBS 202.75 TaxID=1149848 RepID=UPI0037436775
MSGPKYAPYFGVEIEIFVKPWDGWKRHLLELDRAHRKRPDAWKDWDLSLKNSESNKQKKLAQNKCAGKIIKSIIDEALGSNSWKCDTDGSLHDELLMEPDNPRDWWGIEIVSPALSSSRGWQSEIREVFDALRARFEFWTNQKCSCHVHITPGPDKSAKYTIPQLVRVAKGAIYWEKALCDLIPPERRDNRFARPNHERIATNEYKYIEENPGLPTTMRLTPWGLVFEKIEKAADYERDIQLNMFIWEMSGRTDEYKTRYTSTNFRALTRHGTVEFRRQAGAASATTVIHRVLLALTLHASAMRYDFDAVKKRTTMPTVDELIKELAGCMSNLPKTCQGSRFINWLKWCRATYSGNYQPLERAINSVEQSLRLGAEYPDVPTGSTERPPPPSLPPPATGTGAAPSQSRASRPQRTTLPERPAPARGSHGTTTRPQGGSTSHSTHPSSSHSTGTGTGTGSRSGSRSGYY